jgi:hypothetical protein
MIKRLSKIKQKCATISILGLSAICDIAYGAEFGNSADLQPIQQIAQFMLKAGGWIGITSFVVGGILMLALESGNAKNIIITILYFVGGIAFLSWAVTYYNGKMNDISNSIFQ